MKGGGIWDTNRTRTDISEKREDGLCVVHTSDLRFGTPSRLSSRRNKMEETAMRMMRMSHPIDAGGVIQNKIAALHEAYGELESRLSPLLRPMPQGENTPADPSCDAPPARSDLMTLLEEIQDNLEDLAARHARLQSRLDL